MLKEKDYKKRNRTDTRLMNWSVQNTKEEEFQDSQMAIVECTCTNSDGEELQTVKTLEINPEHESWEDWMNELKEERFEIIQCPTCNIWTIDSET
ncbi:hypothetical protein [Guptibacillus algicola]|uniref:hypothetical protein n=1 Tax=Guptibacillus algicola TaxID=225844 RepID=UPI001CD581C3|nr:hypothetical protein [Alkalihalobacillus algicola]MCA0988724.1 hypothetical protein [Alkalihalobacillus algicola]